MIRYDTKITSIWPNFVFGVVSDLYFSTSNQKINFSTFRPAVSKNHFLVILQNFNFCKIWDQNVYLLIQIITLIFMANLKTHINIFHAVLWYNYDENFEKIVKNVGNKPKIPITVLFYTWDQPKAANMTCSWQQLTSKTLENIWKQYRNYFHHYLKLFREIQKCPAPHFFVHKILSVIIQVN